MHTLISECNSIKLLRASRSTQIFPPGCALLSAWWSSARMGVKASVPDHEDSVLKYRVNQMNVDK